MKGLQTFVLIRGLTREQGHWGPFTAQLQQALPAARVVGVDLPGAGLLHRQRSPLRVAGMVDACRQQLRDLDIAGPCHLLGLSMGGMVAAEWARRWPAEVAGCVLVNASMRPYSPPQQRLRLHLLPQMLRVLLAQDPLQAEKTVLQLTSAWPERHAAVLDDWVRLRREHPVSRSNALRQLLAAALYRWPGGPPTVPTLVVCSAADKLVDAGCSARIARAFAAEMLVHPQAGHDLALDDGAWLARMVSRGL